MNKIKNIENVSLIIMRPSAYTKCQIGQDWFYNDFEVSFMPGEYYPDYIEVNDFVQENIEGKELNIEQASRILYDFLPEYQPFELSVTDHIRNCKTHFDVDVII